MIKICIVDAHKLFIEGLKSLFDRIPYAEVTCEAYDGYSAIEVVEKYSPTIVLIDPILPKLNGIEASKIITEKKPWVKIIFLSIHTQRRLVLEVLKTGALGYIVKTVCFDELLTAVRTIETGGVYLSPEISGMVVGEFRELLKKNTEISAFSLLSDREKQILQCISEGRTTKEIAYLIKISTKTVETHRRNIMDKVGVNTIAGLTRYAIQEGICSL